MDNSGPAFPVPMQWRPDGEFMCGGYEGLTKRELAAMLAMQGMLASWPDDAKFRPDLTSQQACAFADAILAELAKEKAGE